MCFVVVGLAAETLSWSQSQTEIVIPNSLYLGNSLSVGSNNIAVFGSNGAGKKEFQINCFPIPILNVSLDSSNGAAYVFTFDQPTNAWSQIQDLKPTGYSSTPFTFGSSSDVFQNTIVIGAASSSE